MCIHFFFSSRRRHTRLTCDWSSDVCSSDLLGFRLTEYTETDDSRAPKLWAVWLHRKGNVHDLAFTNGRGPRLHHIGVWTRSEERRVGKEGRSRASPYHYTQTNACERQRL